MEEMKPYVICIEEKLRRHIIIHSKNQIEAMRIADQAYRSGGVILDADDFDEMSMECTGVAKEEELKLYAQYVGNTD